MGPQSRLIVLGISVTGASSADNKQDAGLASRVPDSPDFIHLDMDPWSRQPVLTNLATGESVALPMCDWELDFDNGQAYLYHGDPATVQTEFVDDYLKKSIARVTTRPTLCGTTASASSSST